MRALAVSTDAKTRKGEALNVLTGVMYFAPTNIAASSVNVCPFSSLGCRAACLYTAGRGAFNSTQARRVAKTLRYLADRAGFAREMFADADKVARKASRLGFIPAVRFNGTSDLPFESMYREAMLCRPFVRFYDYTKNPQRARAYADGLTPANYSLTFSRSESNSADCENLIERGVNVAVVFSKEAYAIVTARGHFAGYAVTDGDVSDARFLDPDLRGRAAGVIVALKAKGKAKGYENGFVVSDVDGAL